MTNLQVEGLAHEFNAIPHVREDMTALILNTQQVRLRFKVIASNQFITMCGGCS